MNAPQRIALQALAPQPWKNGAGLTREIALGGADASRFDWRISLAEVSRDAPFSAFPGIDRCIVLWGGAGMRLRSREGAIDHALTEPFAPFRFAGDIAIDATLVDGACSDLNVMTRRGAFRSEVTCHRHGQALQGADVTLLVCAAGEWLVGGEALPLAPLQALLWRAPLATLAVAPRHADSALLQVRLCHDLQR